ncbi:MAG: DUF5703 domain-containing protein [Thermoproteota archaeon]
MLGNNPYEVIWDTPSEDYNGTVPLGNGEVALNAWVEPSGDLRFYIARTDSWDDYGRLVKVGAIRISVGSNSKKKVDSFKQVLNVKNATMDVYYKKEGNEVNLKLWVDANRPIIVVEIYAQKPISVVASVELWRTKQKELLTVEVSDIFFRRPEKTIIEPDIVLTELKDCIGWCHHNVKSIGPDLCARIQGTADFPRQDPLLHRTFGALVTTEKYEKIDDLTLSSRTGKTHIFEIVVHTKHPASLEEWLNETRKILNEAKSIPLVKRRKEHEKWWTDFWDRSWIHISENSFSKSKGDAFVLTQAYILQRYINACAGRGNYPIKFNGSLFTVPSDEKPSDPDYRRWGSGYWWQNTRLPYYTMCASGDFEMMQPLFKMYTELMPLFKFRTKRYFGHEGAYVPECIYFWGDVFTETYGWKQFEERTDKLQESRWHKWEWIAGLELIWLMLDYFEYTEDEKFLREVVLPFAQEILTFFDQHYSLGPDGKLFIYPAQALETWWECINPMPEVAGLHAVTSRLLELPEELTEAKQRSLWRKLKEKLPNLPVRFTKDGKVTLAPAQDFREKHNVENPELYAVFPFRLVAIGKLNVEWGIEALKNRTDKGAFGWRQDDVFMAYLGQTEQVKEYVITRAKTKHEKSRFPAFWGPNYDWIPDQDHGSVLMKALQSMLVQTDGKRIYLLPAWPKEWDVEFKLHAPFRTTLVGKVKDGELIYLEVNPKERLKDVSVIFPSS